MISKGAGPRLRAAFLAGAGSLALLACSSPEEKVERYYKSGAEYLEEGDLGRANVQFQNVLQIDDRHVPTLEGLASIAEARQDFDAMFGALQRVVRLDPDNVSARTKIGKLYLVGGDETEALNQANAALEIDPDSIDAGALKAGVLLRAGDREQAVALAEEVVAEDRANPEATTVLATVKVASDDLEGGIAELDKALAVEPAQAILQLLRIQILSLLDRSEDIMAGYRRLIELFPEEPAYRRAYAGALIERGDKDGAEAQIREIVEMRPNDLNAKLDVIRIVNDVRGAEAASEQLRTYIENDDDNVDLKLALADFYRQADDPESAGDVLSDIARDDDASVANRARNRLAAIAYEDGEIDRFETLVEEILASDESNVGALTKRAQLKIRRGEFDDAILDLREAQRADPDSTQAMVLLASAFAQKGDRDVARAEFAKALAASNAAPTVAIVFSQFLLQENDAGRAEAVLEQSLERNPRNRDALKLLAEARLRQQDWRGAEEVAEILERLGEDDGTTKTIRTVALSGLDEYQEIIDLLQQGGADEPLAARPLAALVRAYLRQDQPEEARATLDRVIADDPDNYLAYLLLAQVNAEESDTDGFEQTLLRATARAPARPEAYELLYRYYLRRNQTEKARGLIEDAIERSPEASGLKIFRADIFLSEGRREEALAVYEEIIEERSADPIVVNNFVSLASDLRPDQESAKERLALLDAIDRPDANPFFVDTIGWAHYRAGDYDEAVERLSAAAQAASGNAEVRYHLGAAQMAAGNEDAARTTLQEALRLGGDDFVHRERIETMLGE